MGAQHDGTLAGATGGQRLSHDLAHQLGRKLDRTAHDTLGHAPSQHDGRVLGPSQVLLGLRTRRQQQLTYLCQSRLLTSLETGALRLGSRSLRLGPQGGCISLGPRPNLCGLSLCGENRSRHHASQAFLQSAHAFTFYHFTHCRPSVAGKPTGHRPQRRVSLGAQLLLKRRTPASNLGQQLVATQATQSCAQRARRACT